MLEERKKELNKKIVRAREGFSLPSEISSRKEILDEGVYAFVFRHNELGDLGRILVFPHPNGESQFNSEVLGDKDDPMIHKRREIFEPIANDIIERISSQMSEGTGQTVPNPYNQRQMIPSTVFPCDKCGQIVGMMVVDQEAFTKADLETLATLMYTTAREQNIPTWVVGHEKEITLNGEKMSESLMMKIYPQKEEPKIMTSKDFDIMIDILINNHCK
jgi:hypothetical protein